MRGSPNYVRFVYDGDGSDSDAGPAGSAQIEALFNDYFASQGLETEPTAFDGRSDYGPCYHEACDDITNLNTKALLELGDAAAHPTLTLAKSKEGLFEDGSRVGQRSAKAAVKAKMHAHADAH